MTTSDFGADDPNAVSHDRRERDRVLDAGALRALAHPIRVQIYDVLSQYGPQTASSLAAILGESTGSTSYHLRALAKQDLIREREEQGKGRERWWERPAGGVEFTSREALKTPSGRAASQIVMDEFARNRQEQLLRFLHGEMVAPDPDWPEATLISTANTRLTPQQSKKLRDKIMAVIDETVDRYRDQVGEGVRPVTIRADIFPFPELGEHR